MIKIDKIFKKLYKLVYKNKSFPGTEEYWNKRYTIGGNSGPGSYNDLAIFKASVINYFIEKEKIKSVIEHGCGDGNQLKLLLCPTYIGFDISNKAILICKEIFKNDRTKTFILSRNYKDEKSQLTISLDVIYHLIEDNIFDSYMRRLFQSSEKFVIIYSSNYDEKQKYHELRRKFTTWTDKNMPEWKLTQFIPNKYPYSINKNGSKSDFYIYTKRIYL